MTSRVDAAGEADGRWLASGGGEIYIRPYPDLASRDPQKIVEGTYPAWNRSELFHVHDGTLWSVEVDDGGGVTGDPKKIIEGPYFDNPGYGAPYDYDPVTDRFLVVKSSSVAPMLVVVQGLDEELKKKSNGD